MESIGLLIVPYGIETEEAMQKQWELELLIVPYGIETILLHTCINRAHAFNRTLWN